MGSLISQFIKPEEKESEVGDYSYLDERPDRLMSPGSTEEDWYSQFYPYNVPWWFYQFMDHDPNFNRDETLPYKLENM